MTNIGSTIIMEQCESVANERLYHDAVSVVDYHTDRFCVYTRREHNTMTIHIQKEQS
jgi:hypothetical protein